MAKSPLIYLFLIAISLSLANSARILDDVDQLDPSLVLPTTASPSGQPPADPDTDVAPDAPATVVTAPIPVPAGPATPLATGAASANPAGPQATPSSTPQLAPANPDADMAPNAPATVANTPIPVPAGPTTPLAGATTANPTGTPATPLSSTPQLSFYMHDILGGTHPSTRVVTGINARSDINGIPFSQPNNNIFPLQGGVPLTNFNNLINQNTVPFLTGLNGGSQSTTVLQNAGNNNNAANSNNQPFVTAGQLPAGSTLQKLMFGSITVVDDELTEGEELGSGVMGQAQGFYLSSSLDGTSHTVALTLLLHEGGGGAVVGDSISLFGVHRTAAGASEVAVVGGTGKYEGAGGYATVETILKQEDQHTTDGVDTIMHVGVYLS